MVLWGLTYFNGAAGSVCSGLTVVQSMGTYSGGSYWDSVRSTHAQDHTPGTERPTWGRGLGAAVLTVTIQSSGIQYGTAQARCGPAQAASLNLPPAEGRQMTSRNERIRVVYDQNIAKNSLC